MPRYTANWSDWSGIYGNVGVPGPESGRIDERPINEVIFTPQKFAIVGEVRVSRHDIEDNVTSVAKVMAAMVEALEGYMSVTSAVLTWEQEFQIQEGYSIATDEIVLRAGGVGYFDAPSDGHTEIIDVTPREEPYSAGEDGQACPNTAPTPRPS